MTVFAELMADVARQLLGDPNSQLSSKSEWRYGTNGSLSVDVQKGVWHDFETETSGGVLDLIARQTGRHANGSAGGAVEWLRENGYAVDDPHGAPERPAVRARGSPFRVVKTWPYLDETGDELFQVQRLENGERDKDGKAVKRYVQRRKATAADDRDQVRDGYVYSVRGVRQVPYRLPELTEALSADRLVAIVEGEKCADALWELGVPATTSAMGAGKWKSTLNDLFAGADIIIIPDNDDPGREHAGKVAAELAGVAARLRVLALPDLPLKGDVVDWIERGGTAAALFDLVDSHGRSPTVVDPELHFEAVWFADVGTTLADPEWLVDDVLTRGDRSLVYGPSKSGKSFLATDAALCIVRGLPFFDHEVIQGAAIYVAAEGKKGFKNRLRAYCLHHGIDERADLPFILLPVAVDMFDEQGDYPNLLEDLAALSERVRARGSRVELVVFDTHAAVSPGANENASEDVSRLMRHYDKAQAAAGGAHVMVVHHTNAAADRPRGWSGLYAGFDNALEVEADAGGDRTATVVKLKDGEDGTRFHFRLRSVEVGQRQRDGRMVTSCVVEPTSAEVYAERKKGPRLTAQEHIAMNALREAVLAAGEPPLNTMHLPAGVKVVRIEYWQREFLSRAFNELPSESTARTALKRVADGLVAKHVIGRALPFVWIAKDVLGG